MGAGWGKKRTEHRAGYCGAEQKVQRKFAQGVVEVEYGAEQGVMPVFVHHHVPWPRSAVVYAEDHKRRAQYG